MLNLADTDRAILELLGDTETISYTLAGGSPVVIEHSVFFNPATEQAAADVLYATQGPNFLVHKDDLPGGAKKGDTITRASGEVYTIAEFMADEAYLILLRVHGP